MHLQNDIIHRVTKFSVLDSRKSTATPWVISPQWTRYCLDLLFSENRKLFGAETKQIWKCMFPTRWGYTAHCKGILLLGDISWPARSPDLAPCDFFLWGYLKEEVFRHTCRIDQLEDAIRLPVAAISERCRISGII